VHEAKPVPPGSHVPEVKAEPLSSESKHEVSMHNLPEKAVSAAATAMFEHSVIASWDAKIKARRWLENATQYRGLAQAALLAARPHM
jgi:hypothetical protein